MEDARRGEGGGGRMAWSTGTKVCLGGCWVGSLGVQIGNFVPSSRLGCQGRYNQSGTVLNMRDDPTDGYYSTTRKLWDGQGTKINGQGPWSCSVLGESQRYRCKVHSTRYLPSCCVPLQLGTRGR